MNDCCRRGAIPQFGTYCERSGGVEHDDGSPDEDDRWLEGARQRPAAAQVLAPHSMPATILNLQRTVGNRLVQRLVRGPAPSQPTAGRSRRLFAPTAVEPMQADGKRR